MVSLYVLNPAHKLRFLSKLILKGSKRILKDVSTSSTSSLALPLDGEVKQTKRTKINVLNLIKSNLDHVPQEGLTRDPDYYKDDSEDGFCVFRVESTLFKVAWSIISAYVDVLNDIRYRNVTFYESRQHLEICSAFPLLKERRIPLLFFSMMPQNTSAI